ncbi:MAG: transglycosylase SLT domain-containing protein [candidate division Zixibacteria bacterium]|nr:transglycosylase SLT domain-containing protein [candidate division Zixibacteria bacterium]
MLKDIAFEKKIGIIISRPLSVLFLLIYLLQSTVLVYFVYQYYEQQQVITHQQKRIVELEEKLQILKIIEDFQIGFTDTEIGQLTQVIYDESKRYGYDPRLLLALILTESSMIKGQRSYRGAQGLMQMLPSVGHDIARRRGLGWQGELSLFEPAYNIRLGSLYLFELTMKFLDVRKAVIAYNLGETELRRRLNANRDLPKRYLAEVLSKYRELLEKYPDV